VAPAREGVLLRFDVALDRRTASDPANYSAERWNYRRTAEYGSPHFTMSYLRKGQDGMIPSSAYVSRDGKAVFVGLPDMQPVMQMRLGWTLKTAAGATFEESAYITPQTLARFDPGRGLDAMTVDLAPVLLRAARVSVATPVTARPANASPPEWAAWMPFRRRHGQGRVGPSWKGCTAPNGRSPTTPERWPTPLTCRQSILEPSARIVAGFAQSDAGMPSYAGVLTESRSRP
jgi:hypothetical protein